MKKDELFLIEVIAETLPKNRLVSIFKRLYKSKCFKHIALSVASVLIRNNYPLFKLVTDDNDLYKLICKLRWCSFRGLCYSVFRKILFNRTRSLRVRKAVLRMCCINITDLVRLVTTYTESELRDEAFKLLILRIKSNAHVDEPLRLTKRQYQYISKKLYEDNDKRYRYILLSWPQIFSAAQLRRLWKSGFCSEPEYITALLKRGDQEALEAALRDISGKSVKSLPISIRPSFAIDFEKLSKIAVQRNNSAALELLSCICRGIVPELSIL